MTQDEAFEVLRKMRREFGWSIKVFTRDDAANAYDGSDSEGPLSDAEWETLSRSKAWQGMDDVSDAEWDELHSTVYSVLGREGVRQGAEAVRS